jgi:hypothetical protein
MPSEPRLVRQYRQNRATADAEAAVALEEPVIFGFFGLGLGRQGMAKSIITGLAGGVLGDMVVRGAGEIASHLAEAVGDVVEGVVGGAGKKPRQECAYEGSKSVEIEFKKNYYIAIGASVVGVFRTNATFGITGVLKGIEPLVIIPREAIRQVGFQDSQSERSVIIAFEDGGFIGFWVTRPPKSGLQKMLLGGGIASLAEIAGKEIYEGVLAAFVRFVHMVSLFGRLLPMPFEP